MLGPYGETLVVDWGLAKVAGRPDGEPSTADASLALLRANAGGSTEPGSWLGTPAYMSPEQAAGRIDQLGPASDIYSLGATLYNLLTGKTAFDGADVFTLLGKIRAGDFPPPRSVDPTIDRALESVCLKAMALAPGDRYPSCRALADDLKRWAADEPVSAWQEPVGRRVRRWAKRNRTAMTGAAVALVAGVVGLSAVLAVQTRAKADLAASLTRERRASTALAASNTDLTRSRAAVQARYDLAMDAIKTFHTGVSEDFLLKEEKFQELRNRLLTSASEFYGRLGGLLGKETDPASLRAVWQANFELAELTGKVGRAEDALAAHRQALAVREALAAGSEADPEIKAEVGRSLTAIGSLLGSTGKTNEAEVTYHKAETLLAELLPTVSGASAVRGALAECRSSFGYLLEKAGRLDEALSLYRLTRADLEAMAAEPGAKAELRRNLAITVTRTGSVLRVTGKPLEAEAELRKALAFRQKLVDDNPKDSGLRSDLAHTHNHLGIVMYNTGRLSETLAESRKALALAEKVADDSPAVTQFRSALAELHGNLVVVLAHMGKLAEAEIENRKATGDPPEVGRRQPRRHQIPTRPGGQLQQPRPHAPEEGQVGGSGGRAPPQSRDQSEVGRRQPQGPGLPRRRRLDPRQPRRNGSLARPGSRGARQLRTGDRRRRTAGRGEPDDDVIPQQRGSLVAPAWTGPPRSGRPRRRRGRRPAGAGTVRRAAFAVGP